MALPSFTQHLALLEGASLVTSIKHGRIRTYRLAPLGLDVAHGWLADQRQHWEQCLDQFRFDQFLINQQEPS